MNSKAFYLIISLFCTVAVESRLYSKNIVIGLDSFLFKENEGMAIDELGGYAKIIGTSLWTWKSPLALQDRFFELLNNIVPITNETPLLMWRGKRVPKLICDFLINKTNPEQILAFVKQEIEKKSLDEQHFMLTLAEIAFNPEKNAESMQKISEGIELIQRLKQQGHTIYIVENWNQKALEKLKTKFPLIFANITSSMISGDTQKTKKTGLYEHFFYTHPNLEPNDTIVIETEKSYCEPLYNFNRQHNKNVHVILCDKDEYKKKFKHIKKELRKVGVLPKK